MNTKDSVLFRCPHCGARVRVNEHLLGDEVTCANPDCGRPFFAEAPVAQPITEQGDGTDDDPNTYEIDRVAHNNEEMLKIVHPSMWRGRPLQFLAVCALLALGCAAIFAGLIWGATPLGLGAMVVAVIGLAIAAIAGGILLVWWIKAHYTVLLISNKRTVFRQGFVSRETSEVQHDDVRNLQMDQSIIDRIMQVGDIAISSAGQDEMEIRIAGIPHPDEVVSLIRQMQ